jgi:hypothetical protein
LGSRIKHQEQGSELEGTETDVRVSTYSVARAFSKTMYFALVTSTYRSYREEKPVQRREQTHHCSHKY